MNIDKSSALRTARRAGIAAFIGTTIEWYDFFVFTTASGLVFGKIFFPELASGAGALASFATLWVGYIARPLGGVVFGHIGDRFGRRKALIITLLGMGCSTVAIGLLPTYQQAGLLAPAVLALLRIVQGVALGGEWGGAVLIASESAPKEHRVSFGNFAQQGAPAGSMLSTLVFIPVAAMPSHSFETWGWRLPFLFSALLVVVGLVIRIKLDEPPEFEEVRRTRQVAKVPVVEVFRGSTGLLVLAVGVCAVGVGMSGMKNPFALSWLTGGLGIPRTTVLNILLLTTAVQFLVQPVAAHWAWKYGALRIMTGSLVATAVTMPVAFAMMDTGSVPLVAVGFCVFMATQSGYYAVLAGFLSDGLFPARIRYTGISLSYQLSATVFGGIPFVAQLLLDRSGGIWASVAFYLSIVLLATGCAPAIARRQRHRAPSGTPVTSTTATESGVA
ncbi:MFS transporter [Streptomyces sp. NPDC051956]|uniref:MFS transporter n=1 Tax=Streptomyces sp. NPDC051956 TaxID=3365677 RepID=UPI0037CDD1BF